jgi:histidinol-phosphate/aromatic aminotransferase/cobyric acid decarboxylase-like protein
LQIPERQLIDDIDRLEAEYQQHTGVPPENLSHWDAGAAYHARLLPLSVQSDEDILDYIFSDALPDRYAVAAKLGFEAGEPVITNSGTASISLVLHFIASAFRRPVIFLGPTYFSAVHLARRLMIAHDIVSLDIGDGQFSVSNTLKSIELGEQSMLWITNPVYGTGHPYVESDIQLLAKLVAAGHHLILDECYAAPKDLLGPRLFVDDRVISISSPHKALNVNAVKFSMVIASRENAASMDHLTDLVTGSLSASTRSALKHFMSDDYDRAISVLNQFTAEARRTLVAMIAPQVLGLLPPNESPFLTLNIPNLSAELGWDREFLRRLLFASGATVIPACRNWMNAEVGFAFRVNLARSGPQFWNALARAAKYLISSVAPISGGRAVADQS